MESIPKIRLDQKRTKPGLGFEKAPTPSWVALKNTKIEIPSQKRPLAKSYRFTLPPHVKKGDRLPIFLLCFYPLIAPTA
jgi:hypothetical protein